MSPTPAQQAANRAARSASQAQHREMRSGFGGGGAPPPGGHPGRGGRHSGGFYPPYYPAYRGWWWRRPVVYAPPVYVGSPPVYVEGSTQPYPAEIDYSKTWRCGDVTYGSTLSMRSAGNLFTFMAIGFLVWIAAVIGFDLWWYGIAVETGTFIIADTIVLIVFAAISGIVAIVLRLTSSANFARCYIPPEESKKK